MNDLFFRMTLLNSMIDKRIFMYVCIINLVVIDAWKALEYVGSLIHLVDTAQRVRVIKLTLFHYVIL